MIQGQTALLYGSLNITDDQGRNATTVNLDPPMACEFPRSFLVRVRLLEY